MKNFTFETWDRDRLTVNAGFSELLAQHQLSTNAAIWQFSQSAMPVKQLRTDRVTLRFTLRNPAGEAQAFYMKRFLGRIGWWRCPAKQEWQAILAFHQHDLPTMTPVAYGSDGSRSFVITVALENCRKLSELFPSTVDRRDLIERTACIARQMHGARLHHQDFYLGHLLQQQDDFGSLAVIDLGRAGSHGRILSARWIMKDLAQLNYSATTALRSERLRFLKKYLGRDLLPGDRRLIHRILRKTKRITRHTLKHGL